VESRRQNRQSCGDEMDALLEGPEEYIVLTRDQYELLKGQAADHALICRASKPYREATGGILRSDLQTWAARYESMQKIQASLEAIDRVSRRPDVDSLALSWEPDAPLD